MIPFWWGVLIVVVLAIIVAFVEMILSNEERAIFSPLILIIAFFLLAHSALTIDGASVDSYTDEITAHSLKSSDGLEGDFFLGIGSFDSNKTYYCYTGNKIDGFIISKFDAEKTYIIPSSSAVYGRIVKEYSIMEISFGENILFGKIIQRPSWKYSSLEKQSIVLPEDYIVFEYQDIK